MRTAIVIPARLSAVRLPRKPLAMLGELPLVIRVAQQAHKCPNTDHVAIATDSDEIHATARAHGIDALLTRADHPSGTDRVAEAAAVLGVEVVVNLQGDEPFVDPWDLFQMIRALTETQTPAATLRYPLTSEIEARDSNVVKVVTTDRNQALYFSRAPIPYHRTPTGNWGHRHLGVYGYQRTVLDRWVALPPHPLEQAEGLEQLRALAAGIPITLLDARGLARGIDSPEDLAWAQVYVQQHGDRAFPDFTDKRQS